MDPKLLVFIAFGVIVVVVSFLLGSKSKFSGQPKVVAVGAEQRIPVESKPRSVGAMLISVAISISSIFFIVFQFFKPGDINYTKALLLNLMLTVAVIGLMLFISAKGGLMYINWDSWRESLWAIVMVGIFLGVSALFGYFFMNGKATVFLILLYTPLFYRFFTGNIGTLQSEALRMFVTYFVVAFLAVAIYMLLEKYHLNLTAQTAHAQSIFPKDQGGDNLMLMIYAFLFAIAMQLLNIVSVVKSILR